MRTFRLYQKCISLGVKIDGSTPKPFNMVQAIRSGEARLIFRRDVPCDWLNVDGVERKKAYPTAAKALSSFDQYFHPKFK